MAFHAEPLVLGLQCISPCVSAGILFAAAGAGETPVSVLVHDFLWADLLLLRDCGIFRDSLFGGLCGMVSLEKAAEAERGSALCAALWDDGASGNIGNGN